jgi:S1-C subfamily serine protease
MMDDQTIRSRDDLSAFLSGKQPADKITVTILRDGQEVKLDVILGQAGRRRR